MQAHRLYDTERQIPGQTKKRLLCNLKKHPDVQDYNE